MADDMSPSDIHTIDTPIILPPSTVSKNRTLSDLPIELLMLIFVPLRPVFKQTVPPNSAAEEELFLNALGLFRQDMTHFAEFRRICIATRVTVTSILYREVIICFTSSTPVETVADLFNSIAPHVRSLKIYGPWYLKNYSSVRFCRLDEMSVAIGRGLNRCCSLNTLECFGCHKTFTKRQWLSKFAPSIQSTITHLTFCAHGIDLSYALVGMGRSLEVLEILHWCIDDCYRKNYTLLPSQTPHFPAELPKLKHLTLRGGTPRFADVEKLLNRIGTNKDGQRTFPLESLSLLNMQLGESAILDILRIRGVGFVLSTFHTEFGSWNYNPSDSFPKDLFKAAPNLRVFRYMLHADLGFLADVPRSVQYLGFSVAISYPLPRIMPEVVVEFLKARHRMGLHSVSISTDPARTLNYPAFVKECGELGFEVKVLDRRFGIEVVLHPR